MDIANAGDVVADESSVMTRRLLRGHDILCLSSIDWQFIWQGHQEIMSTLAAAGNRVLFVENTGVRRLKFRDLSRVRDRLRNWRRGTKGFREERENLYVYSPIILPFPYSGFAKWVNKFLMVRALRRWMAAIGFRRPLVWTFLPTPLVRDVIRVLDPELTVYYCIDDLASSSSAARPIEQSEISLFREADLVFVTSEKLRTRAAINSNHVHLFPFGVNFEKFTHALGAAPPQDLSGFRKSIVGYVGGIHKWIDFELLEGLARRLPEVTFVLVGPIQTDTSCLANCPNIHLLGARTHDELPRYIGAFDVGIVPYVLSDYTANVYPTKLNEYLAMGIPVVATDLLEIRRFNRTHGDVVAVANDAETFAIEITNVQKVVSEDERSRRIAVAEENSWQSRIERMSEVINESIQRKATVADRWDERLRLLYWQNRRRVAAAIVSIVVPYVLVFETNLPWLMAEPLRLSEEPSQADVIVVFAGGVGESGQAGGGYQERVRAAVDLYQAGYAPRMIFSSGYEFAFRETEVMRSLAMSQGVPASAIVLETRASSTYENVVFVYELLEEFDAKTILLVSSPYHMRRALLTWEAQASDIEVVPTPVRKSQFYRHARGARLEQLKGLGHEYAAISWYWWKGWL